MDSYILVFGQQFNCHDYHCELHWSSVESIVELRIGRIGLGRENIFPGLCVFSYKEARILEVKGHNPFLFDDRSLSSLMSSGDQENSVGQSQRSLSLTIPISCFA